MFQCPKIETKCKTAATETLVTRTIDAQPERQETLACLGERALRYPYMHNFSMVDPKARFGTISIAMNAPDG
jgi:hypothetical protein